METSAFFLIGVVITLAAFLGAWATFLKQPIFPAYILAGVLAGPLIFRDGSHVETFNLLRDLGLAFVLFLVGLDLKVGNLKFLGRGAIFVGIKQIILTIVAGVLVAKIFGFGNIPSIYIGIALAFSSTIVAVKLLTEKRDLDSLYGQLTVVILLLQDFLAIFLLMLIAGLGGRSISWLDFAITGVVGSLFLAVGYYLTKNVLPYLFDRIARSSELLFVGSLAWMFIVAGVASFVGFSVEIGAFLAGIGIANLPEEHQIASRIRPLRDFFILIFFILIGANIPLGDLPKIIIPAVAFTLFVLLIKPIVTMYFLSREGYRKRTSFMVGSTVAQISEFSLIIIFLGQSVGHLTQEVVGTVTTAMLLSIAASSYVVTHGTKVFKSVSKYLNFFDPGRKAASLAVGESMEDHFVLAGTGRLGWGILKSLQNRGEKVLVVDFNPKVVEELRGKEIPTLFGDITDPEILEAASLSKAKMIVSTMFDTQDTEDLLKYVSTLEKKIPIVVTAPTESAGLDFYAQGAAYVIIPRVISSKYFSNILGKDLEEMSKGEMRAENIEALRNRLQDRGVYP